MNYIFKNTLYKKFNCNLIYTFGLQFQLLESYSSQFFPKIFDSAKSSYVVKLTLETFEHLCFAELNNSHFYISILCCGSNPQLFEWKFEGTDKNCFKFVIQLFLNAELVINISFVSTRFFFKFVIETDTVVLVCNKIGYRVEPA